MAKLNHLLRLLLLVVFPVLTLAACDKATEPANETSPELQANEAPEASEISSASITLEMLPGAIPLQDGRYEQAGGAHSAHMLAYTKGVFAEDGRTRAAALFSSTPGGSGIFYEVLVFEQRDGEEIRQVASALIGDRIDFISMGVRNGTLELEFIGHGEDDSMCCPTVKMFRAFRMTSAGLQEIVRQ